MHCESNHAKNSRIKYRSVSPYTLIHTPIEIIDFVRGRILSYCVVGKYICHSYFEIDPPVGLHKYHVGHQHCYETPYERKGVHNDVSHEEVPLSDVCYERRIRSKCLVKTALVKIFPCVWEYQSPKDYYLYKINPYWAFKSSESYSLIIGWIRVQDSGIKSLF